MERAKNRQEILNQLQQKYRAPLPYILVHDSEIDVETIKLFLPDLLGYACWFNGQVNFAWEAILNRLPREWVIENIDRYLDEFLASRKGDEYLLGDYSNLLTLYAEIDLELLKKRLEKMCIDSNPEVRELAEWASIELL